MSSRDRKRAERRKRKQRASGSSAGGAGWEDADALITSDLNGNGAAPPEERAETIEDIAAEADRRGMSRSELRNQQAREELEPLEEGERPRIVTIGATLSALIAASIIGAWIAGVEVRVGNSNVEERPNAFQVFPPAILFAVMAFGMWRARYWAVLGFEAIMAIIMVGSFITLIAATSAFQAITAGGALVGAGLLFWFTVKALARIQMPSPTDR